MTPFHLAFTVSDLEATRLFFCDTLGCTMGRSAESWIDFNFFGHQITAHQINQRDAPVHTNMVDGKEIPSNHFGVILDWDQWHALLLRLSKANVEFLLKPNVRFEGQIGEQATLILKEPSGNALEFKAFKDRSQIFAN